MMKTIFLALSLIFLASCSHLEVVKEHPASAKRNFNERKLNYFVWGLVRPRPIQSKELCPGDSLASLEFKMTTQDILLSVVTLGIYVPRHLIAACVEK